MRLKFLRLLFSNTLFILVFILFFSYSFVSFKSRNQVFDSIEKIPYTKYALLLGTSKYMDNGMVNLFFTYRCNAVLKIWKKGVVSKIIISGDSTNLSYDEPELMKKELIKHGIPAPSIVLDKKGFNTRASILFCKSKNIGSITIISQEFHNERAVFLAREKGISAIGYNADPVFTTYGVRVWIREWFARVKMMFEVIVLDA